jgi:Thioredoxin
MDESFECGFGQIDVVENAALSRKFQIRTFPTVMLFQGLDEFKPYHGALREKE